jgi:polyribonucleotide nucleotidyltransferase
MKGEIFNLLVGKKNLEVIINNLAERASGSCFVRYGDTLVLVTTTMSENEKDSDFFPLTVEYEEKFYAAGRILGSRFIRREGRPQDEAILTARLIDRAIRPLFPECFFREVQVIATCLSWDKENDPDILGLLGASISLGISPILWNGPVGVVRIGKINNEIILNPTYEEREKGDLDIVFAGVERNGEILINMIEAGAKEVSEDDILLAYKKAEPEIKKIINFQKDIFKKFGKEKITLNIVDDVDLKHQLKNFLGNRIEEIIFSKDQKQKNIKIDTLKKEVLEFIEDRYPGENKGKSAMAILEEEIKRVVHEKAVLENKRADGRGLEDIRDISCDVGLLPRTHGSGLFCRGQTKVLSILTLGSPGDVKILEGMEFIGKKRFMHHYNFPPYSAGEVKPLRGPGRREIGHGMLVEKALSPIIPSFDKFPYTIRIVSEILSSNGSTSMASCSSASLALMDAGVPIKGAVAGISIGLMSLGNGSYKLLVDIQGPEDHYGDMDFKIAGTKNGVTAIQLDVKIDGITLQMIKESLFLAKKSRNEILNKMSQIIPAPRQQLSPFAPVILTLQINPDKIREVIGPGGKVINKIIEDCGVLIDIEDNGMIFVTAEKEEAAEKAISWIKNITREIKVGEIFDGQVKRILDFGAFVEILPGQEGLIHISKLSSHRINKVEDVVKIGDIVKVKVINIDEQGRINLSLLDQNTGQEIIKRIPKKHNTIFKFSRRKK